ncbi:hypothetical protein Golomagni_06430, partial [Golovinomyces magnicellulatus]
MKAQMVNANENRSKCNRALPCDSCTRRGHETACRYATNALRSTTPSLPAKTRAFKDRLDSLEKLVSSLAAKDSSDLKDFSPGAGNPTAKSAVRPLAPRLQETDNGQLNYIDPSHWESILEDIREFREHLSPSETLTSHESSRSEGTDPPSGQDTGFLFGDVSGGSIKQLLTVLPTRPICDMLLAWFFNARFMNLGMVHPVKFQTEYKAFWEAPETTTPLWIGLLFSILSVTVTLRKLANPAPLGLSAFALTTFVLSLVNLHTRNVAVPNVVISLAFGYGGLVQLLAVMVETAFQSGSRKIMRDSKLETFSHQFTGLDEIANQQLYFATLILISALREMACGNTFGATALSSYGGFWIAYAILLVPQFHALDPEKYTAAAEANVLGFFLTGWFIFTTLMVLCTLRSTVMFFSLFFTLDLAFLFLACE